jgi:S1-C subfamily serine protease
MSSNNEDPAGTTPAETTPAEAEAALESPGDAGVSRRGLRPRMIGATVVLGAAVIGLAGFFVGRATGNDAGSQAGAPTTTTVTTTSSATPDVPAGTSEPVAAVARALAPSVVQIETRVGLGSGVVYDADESLILTAAHVVAGADQVQVVLADGTRLAGTVLGIDDGTDVGVVQVDGAGLAAAPLAEGIPAEVGQMAVAIGSPFGLEGTVTAGIVSSEARAVTGPDGRTRTLIQTDAAINPGNSGGALADRHGRVIGINDFIVSLSGGNEGIGFAIPIDVALRAARSIVAGEPMAAGYLGVTGTDPTSGRSGALITGVSEPSPAATAGLQVGDLVVAIDGSPVSSIADLAAAVQAESPGTVVTLDVVRGTETIGLAVELGTRPG